jgi:hypothetical protein
MNNGSRHIKHFSILTLFLYDLPIMSILPSRFRLQNAGTLRLFSQSVEPPKLESSDIIAQ